MHQSKVLLPLLMLATAILVAGCSPGDPLARLQKELDRYPEYSIILNDMRIDGNFSKDYYHQYKVITAEKQSGSAEMDVRERVLDAERVSKQHYARYQDKLGMVLVSKTQDGIDAVPQPAQYRYVGDNRYGQWRTHSNGTSFWEFYGQYALISHMVGSMQRPIYRSEWDSYRGAQRRGQTFYGPNNDFGTRGSVTRTSNPNFFQRQQARQSASRNSFQSRVRSRASSTRSSSSRGGK